VSDNVPACFNENAGERKMGFVGKLLGGTIGFALGGPLGAIAGAAFGHTFDQPGGDPNFLDAGIEGGEARAQLTFFVGTFSMLAKLARSDGRITPQEVDAIERFMAVDLGLDPESRRAARGIFNKAVDSGGSFQDYAAQFYEQFQGEPHLLEMMIDIMLRVSVSDGKLSDTEESLILSAVRMFRLNDSIYEKIRSRYQADTLEKYYSVLGASPDDTDEKIKQQYRKLVSEYHPDKISSKGLPEAFIQFANDKFREVQDAYEKIKARRGLK
jgi:DnaJ like chaperone protein